MNSVVQQWEPGAVVFLSLRDAAALTPKQLPAAAMSQAIADAAIRRAMLQPLEPTP